MADNEQQLRDRIASLKMTIDSLPSLRSTVEETGIASPETKARAQLITELSENEEELEILLESKRVAAAVRLQDELHPPLNSEDCPICLETIKYVNSETVSRFNCCGCIVCKQCTKARIATCKKEGSDEMLRNKCPLCRENLFRKDDYSYKKIGKKVLEHSNRGCAWALTKVGKWHLNEVGKKFGFSFNKEKGLQLLKQAVDQRNSDALMEMADVYSGETHEQLYYMKEAANLGHRGAQYLLAKEYISQNRDIDSCLHYVTLAVNEGLSIACGLLGQMFMSGECGLTISLVLAKHYFEKCLEDAENDDRFAFPLAFTLYLLGELRYGGVLDVPGHSPIPKILFWGNKALKDWPKTIDSDWLTNLESEAKNHCANCRKEAGCSSLKRCVRCFGAWYCGKDCQVAHWKAGHKIDCIKKKG